MAVAYVSSGAVHTSSTSCTPPIPASVATGDGVIVVVATKPDTATIATPAGWTLVATVAGGGGTTGAGVGPTKQAVFFREKDASWSAVPTFTSTGGSATAGIASRFTKAGGSTWDLAAATGVYGTSATVTNASNVMGSNPGIIAGDVLVSAFTSMSITPTWSAQSVSVTGVTAYGTVTEITEILETTTGNDIGGMVFTVPVTTGTATVAPTVNATASAATRGTTSLIRLREVTPTPISATDTIALSVSETYVIPENIAGTDSSSLSVSEISSITKYEDPATISAVGGVSIGTTGTVTYTLPAHQANDLLLLFVEGSETGGLSAPSGWQHITNSPRPQGSNVTTLNIMYKVATSSSETNPQISGAANHQIGFAITVSNADVDGTWLDFAPTDGGAPNSTSVNIAAGTTTRAPSLVIAAVGSQLDSTTNSFTSFANASLASFGEVGQFFTDTGNGGGIAVFSGVDNSVGTTGATTGTHAVASWTGLQFGIRSAPILDTTIVAGNETNSLSVDESVDVSVVQTSDDSVSIAVSESTELTKTIPVTDTSALGLTESSEIFVTVDTTDTAALGVTDSSGLLVIAEVAASDSAVLSVSESISIQSALSSTDTVDLAVSETALILSTLDRTDSLTIGLTESGSNSVGQGASDSASLSVVESTELFKAMESSDTAALSVSESSSAVKAIDASDTVAISVTESHGFAATLPGTENAALGVTETTNIFVTNVANDSAALGINDAATTDVTISVADTAALSVSEDRTVAIPLTASDTLTIGVTEVGEDFVIGAEEASETNSLAVSETSSIDISLNRTDALVVGLTEGSSIASESSRTDGGSLSVVESTSTLVFIESSDSISINVVESALFVQELTATDEISISVVENTELYQREVEAVTPMVYLNGAWRTGTIVEYRNKAWHVRTALAYRDGEWGGG